MKIVRLLVLTGISVFLSTASVFAATCTKNAAICSDTQLCADARFYNDGKYNWETRPKYLKHVAEAKRRGLNCSVQGPRAQPDTTALDALREQLSQANEKIAKTKQKLTVANEKEACGLKDASSHSGRRTYITRLANKGVGVRLLAELAGHSHISTTQRYIDVNSDQLTQAVELL